MNRLILRNMPNVHAINVDHAFLVTPYLADADATTFDSVFRGEPETWSRLLAQWEKDGTGLMAAKCASS